MKRRMVAGLAVLALAFASACKSFINTKTTSYTDRSVYELGHDGWYHQVDAYRDFDFYVRMKVQGEKAQTRKGRMTDDSFPGKTEEDEGYARAKLRKLGDEYELVIDSKTLIEPDEGEEESEGIQEPEYDFETKRYQLELISGDWDSDRDAPMKGGQETQFRFTAQTFDRFITGVGQMVSATASRPGATASQSASYMPGAKDEIQVRATHERIIFTHPPFKASARVSVKMKSGWGW